MTALTGISASAVAQVRDLFLAGHTVENVLDAGTTGGWGLNDVADLIQVHGWVVDEDDLIHMPLEPGGCQ